MTPKQVLLNLARRLPRWVKASLGRVVLGSPLLRRLLSVLRSAPPWSANFDARAEFRAQQAELTHEAAQRLLAGFARRPLISVIMPVYGTPPQWLRRAVESLQEQYYADWELCAVDDCSPTDAQRRVLEEAAAADPRVRFRAMPSNGGISAASNAALAMARGDYVALLDHDDELTPDALLRVVQAINDAPDADFLYSDECKIDDTPARGLFGFIFKPDWSPEIMFNGMVTGHLTVYSRALVERAGGFRSAYDFSQDYDLALRASELARRIVHIERILYLWRAIPGSAAQDGKDFARESNIAALQAALDRRGIPATAVALAHANCVRIALPAPVPRVSVVIASDSHENLRLALDAIRQRTAYADYEVLAVCNSALAARLAQDYAGWAPLRCVAYDRPYNFSDKCNEGARAATGEFVVFYNDDVFPLQPDWIERLIEYLQVPGVGGVSPKLLREDDTIQYAGMIAGAPGLCGTAYNHVPRNAPDDFLSMHKYVRNVSILSGACCALRREVFWQVGGFDAVNTADAHSDMDLSFRLMDAGLRCVYTPHAVLRHIGNHSWGNKPTKNKADIYCLGRWGARLARDPYFPAPMLRALYSDFRFAYRIHADHLDPAATHAGPDVLLVSHEMSLTGAPLMLLYAARAIRESGGFPVVVAPEDGPMRAEFQRAGIAVIIDASLRDNHFLFERFARNFDLALVNTSVLQGVAAQLSAIPILRTVWWAHESELLASTLKDLPAIAWEHVRLICVSDYARGFLPPGMTADLLRYGIPDAAPASARAPAPGAPLTFVVSGTIEPRKGQDLLVEAVALLPPAIRAECRFVLSGKLWEPHREYWNGILARMSDLPQIEFLGLLDHGSNLDMIGAADVLLCCSRDESVSIVVMEAAMLSKPAIISDRVGAAEFLAPDARFVFESGNAAALAAQIREAHARRHDLPRMGAAARRDFERRMTFDRFAQDLLAILSEEAGIGARQATETRSAASGA